MMLVLTLTSHELRRAVRSYAFFFTLALFLLYQGIVFSVTIALRMHPLSPPGPLLAPFFGGPFWFWPMLLLVVVQLCHDAISRERAARTFDALRASGLSPRSIAVGKFLAVWLTWLWFWAATLPLLLTAWLYFPTDTNWEIGPLLTGYLGVALIGAAALAVGVFFSSLTADARLSGMLTFLTLFSFVLLKIITHPAFGIVRDPTLLKALVTVNFLDMLERFARGRIHLSDTVFLLILTFFCVALTGKVLDDNFRRARKTMLHVFDALAWFILIVFGAAFIFRFNIVWDVRIPSEFDSRLVQRLQRSEPLTLYLFAGAGPAADVISPISELEAQLDRLCRAFPHISWERISTVDENPRVRRLAERFGLDLGALQSDATGLLEGQLVVATSLRHHVVPLSDLFVVDMRDDGLIFQGISTREIDLTTEVPSSCQLVVAADPQTDLSPVEEENLERALLRGIGFVFALRGRTSLPESWRRFSDTCGIRITEKRVEDGFAPVHPPSSEEFYVEWPTRNLRLAVLLPKAIEISKDAQPLLQASHKAALRQNDTLRSASVPPVLAARTGPTCPWRMFVLGFLDVFLNERLSPAGAALNAEVSWLLTHMREIAKDSQDNELPLTPVEHHRLRLQPDVVKKLHVFALVLWPAAALLAGIWVIRKRR